VRYQKYVQRDGNKKKFKALTIRNIFFQNCFLKKYIIIIFFIFFILTYNLTIQKTNFKLKEPSKFLKNIIRPDK
jgi:hypothetical protein